MKTILDLIQKAGGWYPGLHLKIDNPPYMQLVIEAMGESGPCGLPAISVAHYAEQKGDIMCDPEMCFELGMGGGARLNPWYWRNYYAAVEQWSRNVVSCHYVYLIALHEQHQRFAKTWDNTWVCKGTPKSSRTSTFEARPLPWSGTMPNVCAPCLHPQPLERSFSSWKAKSSMPPSTSTSHCLY
jgi:hypothetical protein